MKKLMTYTIAILMGAALTFGAGSASAENSMGFDRLIYGDELYGLPTLITPSYEDVRTWEKLDYGDDLYGLPNISTAAPKANMKWDKLDYGDDMYGLPTLVTVHNHKIAL